MRGILAALLLSLAAAPAASTISGRVTEAGTGRPLPRILVTLVASDARELMATLTDADGRYRFGGVGAGRYAASAAAGEHRFEHLRQWFGEKEPAASRWSRPPRYPIDVTDGSDITAIDIVMTVALGIEGRVLSPWEEPMANVPVVAMRPDGGRVTDNPVHTDDLGRYRLFGLGPGRYRVCAEAPRAGGSGDSEGTNLPFVQTCHPSAANERAASDVTLTSSDVTGIDVRMQRTGGRTISGTVVDAAGLPANGATVMANSPDTGNQMAAATVRDGGFSIAGLVPGPYNLSARIGGQWLGDRNPPARPREMAFAEIDLTAVDTTNLALVLRPGMKLRGRVVFEGGPPAPAQIGRMLARAFPPEFRLLSFTDWPWTAPVRDDLTFEFPEIYPLPLSVWMDGPPGWKVKRVRVEGRDVTYVPTDLTAAREPIEVTLTNRLARAIVHVVDDGGRAVNDATVLALPAGAKPWRTRIGATDAHANANGDATIGPLPAGDYLLVPLTLQDLNLLFFDPSRFPVVADIGTIVTLHEGASPRIEMRLAALPEKR